MVVSSLLSGATLAWSRKQMPSCTMDSERHQQNQPALREFEVKVNFKGRLRPVSL
jgi:hypothetical protein